MAFRPAEDPVGAHSCRNAVVRRAAPGPGAGRLRPAQSSGSRVREIAALRTGIDLGLTVIDTAEVYTDGESERLVAEAVGARRDEVVLVSKVLPAHALNHHDVVAACERSLDRGLTDRLDLSLLHWPRDAEPLHGETFQAFEDLVVAGRIRYWGVSNFGAGATR